MPATFALRILRISKLFEVEAVVTCRSLSSSSLYPSFPSFSESVMLKAESVILKAVDCVHLNCKDFSD